MDPIKAKILAGATIIDVRDRDEYEGGHYPAAINIPVSALPAQIGTIGAKDTSIVVYCASGGRSAIAAAMLKAQGFTDVSNAGGLEDMPD